MLTVVLGGARSGKSTFAVEAGRRSAQPVTFVATAEPFDDDLAERIAHHQRERPDWPTIEEPLEVASVVNDLPGDVFVIVDCLTVWVGNLFHHVAQEVHRKPYYDALVDALRVRHDLDMIVVSNEVGLGLHPDTALGRQYRDELGRLNQRLCALADRSLLLVAGRALPLTDPWQVWP
jgi:adenosylcobinamide kinase/adenosylcobinamide-phosphate guanylyltransferase